MIDSCQYVTLLLRGYTAAKADLPPSYSLPRNVPACFRVSNVIGLFLPHVFPVTFLLTEGQIKVGMCRDAQTRSHESSVLSELSTGCIKVLA